MRFEPWRSEPEHVTPRSRRLPKLLNLYEWAGKKHFVSLKLEGQRGFQALDLRLSKQTALTTAPGPPPARKCFHNIWLMSEIEQLNPCKPLGWCQFDYCARLPIKKRTPTLLIRSTLAQSPWNYTTTFSGMCLMFSQLPLYMYVHNDGHKRAFTHS